jgi:hypothetical protein
LVFAGKAMMKKHILSLSMRLMLVSMLLVRAAGCQFGGGSGSVQW